MHDDFEVISAADLDEEDIRGELIGPNSETTFGDIARYWRDFFPPATGPAETCIPDGVLRWRPSKLPPEPVAVWPDDDRRHIALAHFARCSLADVANGADLVAAAVWRGHMRAIGRLLIEGTEGSPVHGRQALEDAARYAANAGSAHDRCYSHVWGAFSDHGGWRSLAH